MRYLYEDKNAITRSLKEEIDFCRDYLDIQKMRFRDKFEYDIEVMEGLDLNVQVPKMILHTFVENAFKHGIRSYEKGGTMSVSVKGIHNKLEQITLMKAKEGGGKFVITIRDNGIGREAARMFARENPEFSSGRGLEMLYQMISMINKGKKEKTKIHISDLYDNEKPAGTEVQIEVPV